MLNKNRHDDVLRETKLRISQMVQIYGRRGVGTKCPWGDSEAVVPFGFHTSPFLGVENKHSVECKSCREAMGFSGISCPCLHYRYARAGFDRQLDKIIQEVESGNAV